jgi:hypothetical protein
MTTGDKQRARQRADRLNARSKLVVWEVRPLPDGRFEVVALPR